MNFALRSGATAVLAGLLACPPAGARPHAPPSPWQDPAGPPTEGDVWLKRLVGRYRIDGMVHVVAKGPCGQLPPEGQNPPPPPPVYCESVKGMADCVAIGSGPGVQCILQITWPDMYETVYPPEDDVGVFNLPGGVANLAPAMALFGLDPGKSALNHLLVDHKGLSEGGPGFNSGSRMIFKTPCVNWPTLLNSMRPARPVPRSCERIMRIDARPDAKALFLSVDFEIDEDPFTRYELTLRRVPQVQASESPATPPARRQRR
jgi:hypothetical protein